MKSQTLNLGQTLTFSHTRPFYFKIIRVFSFLHSNIRDVDLVIQYHLDNSSRSVPEQLTINLGERMGMSIQSDEIDLYEGFSGILSISILFRFMEMDVDLPITIVYEELMEDI